MSKAHLTVDATSATIGVAQASPANQKKPITIVVYPTIAPEKIVIPIVTCIFGFPLLALLVICCLRHRAKAARERERRRTANLGTDHSAISLVRFSPMHKLGVYLAGGSQPATTQTSRSRSSSLRSERAMSRHFQSLELDTVIEEKNSEPDIESVILSTDRLSISGS